MKRIAKWVLGTALVLVALLAGVAVALEHWIGTGDFRARVKQRVTVLVGVPVQLGRITVDVWPVPAVAIDAVQVRSKPALTLERIEARPSWPALLHARLEITTLVVRNAVLPEQAITAIAAVLRKKQGPAAQRTAPPASAIGATPLPRRALLEHVTWLPAKGRGSTIDAQLQLDPDGLPANARLEVREGRWQGARATVDRGQAGWNLHADIGGGTVAGKAQLQPGPKGSSIVQAQLETSNVEVSALTAPSRTLTGRIEAHTTLHADVTGGGSMADAMHSQTRFTVRNAVVHGIDLAQAVKTIGMNRGGETALDTLAGQVVTSGRAVALNNLVATSGMLSATGHVALAPDRSLSGRITVDLAKGAAGGAVGVPLSVGGTLDAPSVTLTRGALLGAAIGTMVAPGVGTGAGAKLGDKLGESLRGLFGR
ncbi:MAG TPA: hypothetical protein VKD22_02015 [Ramlibacter sp.]|nr:hypothetical protein [Ramlibacter sp.]